jgi:hypothetical protein
MLTCLKAYIAASLKASSLESTACEAPSVIVILIFSTGCPINEPLQQSACKHKLSIAKQNTEQLN